MSAPDEDIGPRDAWLRQALRHAPDADAAPAPALDAAILRVARAAVAPSDERPARALAGRRTLPGGWAGGLGALWAWMARPQAAAGLASVMAATLVGVMWWERSPEEMQQPPEPQIAVAPSSPSSQGAGPASPSMADAARPLPAPQTAVPQTSETSARVAPAEPAARKATGLTPPEAAQQVAAAPPAPAPAAVPASPADRGGGPEVTSRALESAERADLAARGSAATAMAPPAAEAAARRVPAPSAAAIGPALPPAGLGGLLIEIRREPGAWSWVRDDGTARAIDAAAEAWIAGADLGARSAWRAGAVGDDPSTTTLRFLRRGEPRAVLRLGPAGLRLSRDGQTESAELSPGQAAALLSALDALGP